MYRLFLFFLIFPSLVFAEDRLVLVSLAPYRYFVHAIAGDVVKVELMVPSGASSHTYEPTSRQIIQASKADLWFQLGEPFEKKASLALQYANGSMQVIDLRKNVPLLQGQCHHCSSDRCGADLHIWLSPRLAKIQASIIGEALIQRYPEYAGQFRDQLTQFLKQLDTLEADLKETLAPLKNRVLCVSHPAYAYFCQDFSSPSSRSK